MGLGLGVWLELVVGLELGVGLGLGLGLVLELGFHRQRHLVRHDAQQAADALDHLGVVVAAAAERHRAALGQVRPQQLAALAADGVQQADAERAHLGEG